MESRNFAPRAYEAVTSRLSGLRGQRTRATRLVRRSAPLLLGVSLLRCAPDFASLSSGSASGAGGAPASAGTSSAGDFASLGGTAQGGDGASIAGTAGDAPLGGASSGGTGGGAGSAGMGGGGLAGGSAAGAGGAGSGGLSGGSGAGTGGAGGSCAFSHPKAFAFDGFDGGLSGTGFSAPIMTTSSIENTNNGTATVAWDNAVGLTCPGAWRLTADFKGYSASSTKTEIAIGDFRFKVSNWTGATNLHVWVKVTPADTPLQGLLLFAVSDTTSFLYASVYDDYFFRTGDWTEMLLSLTPSASMNPAQVLRIGIQLDLNAAGSAGNPTVPPVTSVWMDDVWVE